MRLEDQGPNFEAVKYYAESVGFDIQKWLIRESSDGKGCECEMTMSARDSAGTNITDGEGSRAKKTPQNLTNYAKEVAPEESRNAE